MARDHARINLDIWSDDDFRDLSSSAQWLYMRLFTHPDLNFAGVTDWRPARIAANTAELTGEDVEMIAHELEAGEFIVVDRRSEECLVRSFVKHDGLLKSPNMAKALAKDHTSIGSSVLRAVVVDQLVRLREQQPELKGWRHIEELLEKRSMTVEEAFQTLPPNPSPNPSENPSGNPFGNPSGNPLGDGSGNPSATPFLPSSLPPSSRSKSKTHVGNPPGRTELGLETA